MLMTRCLLVGFYVSIITSIIDSMNIGIIITKIIKTKNLIKRCSLTRLNSLCCINIL